MLHLAALIHVQVNISFELSLTNPGENISITTETSPDSLVVLGVIDKSLTLLAKACKSVEKSNVRESCALYFMCILHIHVYIRKTYLHLPQGYYYLLVQVLADFDNSGFSGY